MRRSDVQRRRQGQWLAWTLALTVYPVLDGVAAATWASLVRNAAVVVAVLVVRRRRPTRAWTWYFLIAGMFAGSTGDTILQWDTLVTLPGTLTGLGTACQVVSYPPMLLSAIGIAHSRWGRRNTDLLIDTLTAVIAAGIAYLEVSEWLRDGTQSEIIATELWPMTLVLLVSAILFMALRIVFSDRQQAPRSLVLLLLAAGLALGGSVELMITSPGALTGDRSVYTLWLAGAALVALAATDSSMDRLTAGWPGTPERALTPVRVVALVGSLATIPLVLAIHQVIDEPPDLIRLSVGSALLLALVSVRVVRAVTTRRRSDERLHRPVENSLDGICILDVDGQIRFLAGGPWLPTLGDHSPSRLEDVVATEAVDEVRTAINRVLAEPTEAQRLRLPATLGYGPGWLEVLLSNRVGDPAIRGLIANLRDITDQHLAETELNRRAVRDGLTGLGNREFLLDQLASARRRDEQHGTWTGVLFIDLGRFKLINDSLGHDVGDRLLQAVAGRLRRLVRTGDVVTRLGGDEFVVVCPDLPGTPDPAAAAAGLATRLQEAFASPFDIEGRSLVVDGSIGVTVTGANDLRSNQEILRDADTAMYQAKTRGGSLVALFDDELRSAAIQRLETELELRGGLQEGEILAYFQPVVSLSSGRVVGHEALVRWAHPTRGVLAPAEFLAAADASGLIVPLGHQVLSTAMLQYALAGQTGLELSVNLSPTELAQPDIVETVAGLAADSGMPLSGVIVEVTEAALVEPDSVQVYAVQALKHRGVKIALDDFGTGYSSLAYLRRLPVDILKIDRSFVAGIGRHQADEAVVEAVIRLARALDLQTVAEGVETPAQAQWLRGAGCDLAQGYLYGKPAAADDAIRTGQRQALERAAG